MTDKERKDRDERVRLRHEVERWKTLSKERLDALGRLEIRFNTLSAEHKTLTSCYQLLCHGLGRGGKP